MACRLDGAKPILNQCWNIVNWTLRNKLQWNFNRNLNIFIEENAFENVAWKMAAILSRPQCINSINAWPVDIMVPKSPRRPLSQHSFLISRHIANNKDIFSLAIDNDEWHRADLTSFSRLNDDFCRHTLRTFCKIALGLMLIISGQHCFK